MRLTLWQVPTRETRRPDYNTGNSVPTLCDKCVGSLTFPVNHITLKMQEAEPTVYSPYLRRLKRLTICSTGRTFSSVILRPWPGPLWGSNPRPPAQQSGTLPTELTRRRLMLINDNTWPLPEAAAICNGVSTWPSFPWSVTPFGLAPASNRSWRCVEDVINFIRSQ